VDVDVVVVVVEVAVVLLVPVPGQSTPDLIASQLFASTTSPVWERTSTITALATCVN